MGVVSVSMPEGLVEQIDELVEKHNYSGRSEIVRDASRKLVEEFTDKQLEGKQLVAVISALYPYDSPDIETGLTELQHEHSDLIQSNSHCCIGDDDGCLETIILKGTLKDVSTFVRAVETVSEEIRIDHTLYQVDHIGEDRLHLEP